MSMHARRTRRWTGLVLSMGLLAVAPLAPGTFRVTVRNQGPAAVDGAEVMLSGGSLLALAPSQGSCTRRPAACDVGALAAGASATVDVVLSPFSMGKSVRALVEATGALDVLETDDAATFAPSAAWR